MLPLNSVSVYSLSLVLTFQTTFLHTKVKEKGCVFGTKAKIFVDKGGFEPPTIHYHRLEMRSEHHSQLDHLPVTEIGRHNLIYIQN